MDKKNLLINLGCRLNIYEGEIIKNQLNNNNIKNVTVINSCAVTAEAEKTVAHVIRKAKRINPQNKIIVTGCYAQLKPEQITQIPGVDLVVGTKNKFNVEKFIFDDEVGDLIHTKIENVNNFDISYSTSERTRSFIKIQDGCDYSCTYCTIPNARGISRSGNIVNTIEKINFIVDSGIKEIVLRIFSDVCLVIA